MHACSTDGDRQWERGFQGVIRPRTLPELGENAGDVTADRLLGHEQLIGNIHNSKPAGDQDQHFRFTVGEGFLRRS